MAAPLRFPSRRFWRHPPLPSFNFLALCLVFSGAGAALWHHLVEGKGAVIVFVVTGWIVSLCLHEFGHALIAYYGGDWSVEKIGYLDLDPLKYTDPLLSIMLPLLYILIGGFGLPGGAVWINHAAIRSAAWDSAVSAAGPAANVIFILLLAALYPFVPEEVPDLAAAIGVLAYFQATAIVLNLLPIPGLDGFGIIRPMLPGHIAEAGNVIAAGVGFFLIFLVISTRDVSNFIFEVGTKITSGLGIYDVYTGYEMLRFF